MKKNELLQSIKIIILGLVLSLGVVSVFSAVQNGPVFPINVGISPQIKDGGLSVNAFLAANDSSLNGLVTVYNFIDPEATENRSLCADNDGFISLCPSVPIPCFSPNILIGDICTPPPVVIVPIVPTVTTAPVTNITSTSGTTGGNVTSNGGATVTARGIVWSLTANPTLGSIHFMANGTGIGSFSDTINELSAGTTIHIRAYATNSAGTAYGSDVSFTTLTILPNTLTVNITGNGSGYIVSSPVDDNLTPSSSTWNIVGGNMVSTGTTVYPTGSTINLTVVWYPVYVGGYYVFNGWNGCDFVSASTFSVNNGQEGAMCTITFNGGPRSVTANLVHPDSAQFVRNLKIRNMSSTGTNIKEPRCGKNITFLRYGVANGFDVSRVGEFIWNGNVTSYSLSTHDYNLSYSSSTEVVQLYPFDGVFTDSYGDGGHCEFKGWTNMTGLSCSGAVNGSLYDNDYCTYSPFSQSSSVDALWLYHTVPG